MSRFTKYFLTHMKTPKRPQKKLSIGNHNALFQGTVKATGGVRLRFLVLDSKLKDTECVASLRVYTASEVKKLFGGDPEKFFNKHFEIRLSKNTYNDLLTITSCKPKRFEVPKWFISYSESWQQCRNGEKNSAIKEKYLTERKKRDPKFEQTQKIRDLQNKGIRGELPMDKYEELFGIDYEGLRKHIEKSFKKGFTWANRGSVWTLDHIKPLTSFNLFVKLEVFEAISYLNLQALEKQENIAKYNKAPEPKQLSMADRIEAYYAQQSLNGVENEDQDGSLDL